MESLTETLFFILPWFLLGTSLIFYILKLTQYNSICQQLEEAQNIIFIAGKKLGEQSIELEETKEKARKWEKLTTCPPINPIPDPIIVHKSNLQKVCIRTEVERSPVMREKAIREGIDKLTDYIAPLVYSEFITENGTKYLYQEIYVAKPKKVHYEK